MQTEKKRSELIKKGIWLLVFVAALWLLPGLFSLERYVRQAEQLAAESLGVPVTIASASVMLLPSPRIVAHGVVAGAGQEMAIETVAVIPVLSSLLATPRTVDVSVDGVHLKKEVLAVYAEMSARLAAHPSVSAPVLVREVQVKALDASALVELPLLHLRAALAGNVLQHLQLTTDGGSLKVDLAPGQAARQVYAQMHNFVLPGTAISVSQGKLQAVLLPHALRVTEVQMQVLAGEVRGSVNLDWQARTTVNGRFVLNNLSMQALTQAAGSAYLSGRLSGQGTLSAEVAQMGDVLNQLLVQASLEVKDGVLHGIDLVKIARLLLKQGQQGGETHFDTLRSQLKLQGQRAHFRQIEMQSGLIAAKGHVVIMGGKQVQGDVTVAVKETGGVLEVPLEVSGSVSQPTVLPDRAAVVGAAVGTALMPGVGTSLGIKAGSQLKRLFGGE